MSRELDRGFTELCNRGPSVYTSPVNRSTVGFIDNLCASDTDSDPTACFSAIHMQSPFIDEISKSIKEEGACLRDKPFAMTEQRGR